MHQKTLNITGRKKFESQVNNLISKGWKVQCIHTSDSFKVKLIRESNYGYKLSKIPILNSLSSVMLRKIASRLGIKRYTTYQKNILITEIENYKTGYVMDIYNELTNK